MKFHGNAKIEQGVVGVDPTSAPETIVEDCFVQPHPDITMDPDALYLALVGGAGETVTVNLHFLIENGKADQGFDDYKDSGSVWFEFVAGEVITVGTLTKITTGLPAGGIIYVEVTGDTIAAGETRDLRVAWR